MVRFPFPKAPGDTAPYAVSSSERIATINGITVADNTSPPLTVANWQLDDDGFELKFLVGGGIDGRSYVLWLDFLTTDGAHTPRPVGLDVATPS